ncbi:hypothetical protein [Nonomuraea sp. CA-141351]|uniref:hypothetical protein n=1 Tax=Nonomuraea sp. CA-141351 TaxID=3239996 RepID=UPI003D8A4966
MWNNFRYEFRVVAVNRYGPSSATNTVEATPRMTRPRAPTGLAITGTGDGRVELSWQPSPDPPVYYWVFFKSATSSDWYYFQVPTLKTSARLGYPLWNDQPYDFKIVAANLVDQSPASNVVRGGPRLLPPRHRPRSGRMATWDTSTSTGIRARRATFITGSGIGE